MAEVTAIGPVGMVTLRGDLAVIGAAICAESGTAMPGPNRAEAAGDRILAWMSPDELLLILPAGDAAGAVARIGAALAGQHHLAVDVSDARVSLAVTGPDAREVLGKLSPADLRPASFGPGSFRRTRLGQVAAAIWMTAEDRFQVIVFRSVAAYAERLLRQSATDGAVGFYSEG